MKSAIRVVHMANTNGLYVRLDANLKKTAENILSKLGISPSSAVKMLYSQIILKNGLPFETCLPVNKPINIANLSKEELDLEIQKGIDSLKSGEVYTKDEVDEYLKNSGCTCKTVSNVP